MRKTLLIICITVLSLIAQISDVDSTQKETVSVETVSIIKEVKESQNIDKPDSSIKELLHSLYNEEVDSVESNSSFNERKTSDFREDTISYKSKEISKTNNEIVTTPYSKEKRNSLFRNNVLKKADFLIQNIIKLFLIFLLVMLIVIVVWFIKKNADSKKFLTSTRLSLMDKEVQIACKYLENNFYDPHLSVEKLCEDLVTGVAFLEALFQKELGMRVEEFLIQVRINKARIFLNKEPDLSITELAMKCGYEESSLFQEDFIKTTNFTIDDFVSTIKK